MTSPVRIKKWLQASLCGLAVASSASLGYAQSAEDYIVSQFDDGTLQGWAGNYGNAPYVMEFDGNENRGPGASPGAMKMTINFDLCANPVQNQRDWEKALTGGTLDLTKYTRVHFSVKVDPSSSHLSDWGAGAFGNLRPHIRLASWGGDSNLGANPDSVFVGTDAYGNWVDYSYPIDQTLPNLDVRQAMGVWGFDMWSGWGTCAAPIGHTNTVTFWMDNIWFELNTNTAPVPPPMIDLVKAGPAGVQITMNNPGDQWQRDAFVTPENTGPYHWTGQGTYPVTYTMTLADFPAPATATAGFEAHMYLVNQDTSNGNQTTGAPDWNVPDIFILRIENSATEVSATIQWKTNLPNANPPGGALNNPARVVVPNALGTWTLTFNNPTNGVLTAPGGLVSTNFTLPEEMVVNNFSPATSFLQFGIFKNDGPNDGHNNDRSGTYSRVKFDGALAPFDDNFSGGFTNLYAWRRTSATAVQYIPTGAAWRATWTVPAEGHNLEVAGSLLGPWTQVALTATYQSGPRINGIVPQSALPSGGAAFFRTVKRPFAKLQVLLPGETAAPNTPAGKTGTPTEQFVGTPFDITVNAVDTLWNKVSAADTVTITSTEGTATLPADNTLANGTRVFSVTLNAAGSFTVTATDVTDATKTANTSSSITVQ